jgi:2'-5' RNA ligase
MGLRRRHLSEDDMGDQLSFGFGDTPVPTRNDLLYFAVLPEPAAAKCAIETARELKAKYGLSGRPYPPERLHISLAGLGRFRSLPPEVTDRACEIGRRIRMSPFRVALDRVSSFRTGSSRALVLRCSEGTGMLQAIQRQIIDLMHLQYRPFEPHLTLLYDSRTVPEVPVEPIAWQVRDVVLVHSLYGEGRHHHLQRWPLTP